LEFRQNAVFVCEDVSSIKFENGLFYLTDDFGGFEIKRAMRPETFLRCVAGASAVAREYDDWRRTSAQVVQLFPAHAASELGTP
jgi:hypothetical protein